MMEVNQPEHILLRIQNLASVRPARIALVDDSREITYGELLSEIIDTEKFLKNSYRIKPGDRVGILLENSIDSVVAFLAILRMGATAVVINAKLVKPEVNYIIKDASPALLVVGKRSYLSMVEGVIPIYLISPMKSKPHDIQDFGNYPFGFCDQDCAVIMYTSGTTGKPKGAMITHHNMAYAVDCYINDVALTENDITIVLVPLFYVTGLIAQLMVFLSLGAKIILLRRFDADLALQKIDHYRITHLHSVATVYLSLVMSMEEKKEFDLTCIRQALCGGGPISDALIERLKKQTPWLEFRRVYGLTESSSPGTVMPGDVQQFPDKSGSSGLPMRWMQVKVVDEKLQEVEADVVGEFLIKGKNVINGYWNNPEANAISFTNGWFKTGDIAKIDRDGFVYILDRKKDMIIRGGEKIFSSEVEGVIAMYPGVKEVAVIGVPDHYYGEVAKAFVVPMENVVLKIDDLIQFARTRLAKFKVPAEIEFLDSLPKNAVGKILKSALKNKNFNSK